MALTAGRSESVLSYVARESTSHPWANLERFPHWISFWLLVRIFKNHKWPLIPHFQLGSGSRLIWILWIQPNEVKSVQWILHETNMLMGVPPIKCILLNRSHFVFILAYLLLSSFLPNGAHGMLLFLLHSRWVRMLWILLEWIPIFRNMAHKIELLAWGIYIDIRHLWASQTPWPPQCSMAVGTFFLFLAL